MESIEVLEEGKLLSFRFDEMLNYHGPGFPGGVAHGFKVMQRAFPLLDDGNLLERREISFVTAFPGPGDGRYVVDKELPEAANELESPGGRYYFRLSYRGRSVAVTLRPGYVREEFIQLARKKGRTEAEERVLAGMKRDMAARLMAAKAEDIYRAERL